MSAIFGVARRENREEKATQLYCRVVRWDGVVLGGTTDWEKAVRLASVLSQGQRPGFAVARKRGGK